MGNIEEARKALRELNLDTTQIHKGLAHLTEYDINVILRAVEPIITKQQQAKDTAYYAEMLKKAVNKVREKAYKQAQEEERKRIGEWLENTLPKRVMIPSLWDKDIEALKQDKAPSQEGGQ